jgi:DNA-binding NarL/FixJ family response regulator
MGLLQKRHKILVVDDHPIIRHGLAQLIGREADMEVCGQAADVAEALRVVEATQPTAVIIDIGLGSDDGIELIDFIKSRWPEIKMLVSSNHDEETFAGRVLRAGALGYVSKREPIERIVVALRQVIAGQIALSEPMATRLLQQAAVGKPLDYNPLDTLSNRELQVFELIGHGFSTAQIAEKLKVSPKTVESHRKLIKTKLNLQTAAQLSRAAFQWVGEKRQ